MNAPTITPFRSDFFASDTGHATLKIAVENRNLARFAVRANQPYLVKVYRAEMRYYAQIAVKIARRFRAERT
jgi:hypothetical protein